MAEEDQWRAVGESESRCLGESLRGLRGPSGRPATDWTDGRGGRQVEGRRWSKQAGRGPFFSLLQSLLILPIRLEQSDPFQLPGILPGVSTTIISSWSKRCKGQTSEPLLRCMGAANVSMAVKGLARARKNLSERKGVLRLFVCYPERPGEVSGRSGIFFSHWARQ